MKALALLLSAALAAPPDGGTDVPYADGDAGVFEVAGAALPDGGELGPGWWLAPDRMVKVGTHVAELENENAVLRFEATQRPPPPLGFWIGLCIGLATGITGTVVLVQQLRK